MVLCFLPPAGTCRTIRVKGRLPSLAGRSRSVTVDAGAGDAKSEGAEEARLPYLRWSYGPETCRYGRSVGGSIHTGPEPLGYRPADVARLAAHPTCNRAVPGSSPGVGSMAQAVFGVILVAALTPVVDPNASLIEQEPELVDG